MSTYDQDVQTLIDCLSSEETIGAAVKPMLDALEKEIPEIPWESIVKKLPQRISEESVQIYKDRFTHDEVRDLLTFYRTETGTKLLRIYPGLLQDIQAVVLKETERLLQPYLSDL